MTWHFVASFRGQVTLCTRRLLALPTYTSNQVARSCCTRNYCPNKSLQVPNTKSQQPSVSDVHKTATSDLMPVMLHDPWELPCPTNSTCQRVCSTTPALSQQKPLVEFSIQSCYVLYPSSLIGIQGKPAQNDIISGTSIGV